MAGLSQNRPETSLGGYYLSPSFPAMWNRMEIRVHFPKIRQVRAYTLRGGGADYHDQSDGHWIDNHIATPMCEIPRISQKPARLRHQCAWAR